MAYSEH